MSKPPSSSEVLVLGLIYNQPQHGYELNKLIEQRGIRQWADIGFSSIYYLLEKLEKRNLVQSNGATSKSKKTFSITATGKKVCRERTKELIEHRIANKNPFMTGLANSFVLTDAALLKLFSARLAEIKKQLEIVKLQRKIQQPLPRQARWLFEFSIHQINAEIAWLTTAIKDKEL